MSRNKFVAAFIAAGIASSIAAAPAFAADGTTYWYQGTGNTVAAPQWVKDQAVADGTDLVDMSTDRGWKADFRPVQGKDTADQSVAKGIALGAPSIKQDLADGKRVVVKGYSLGALVAGDLAADLAEQGVDISNLEVVVISDGHTANTGALIVLQPLQPVLNILSITAGPRQVPAQGHWTFVCVSGDGVCDTPDPLRDPVGAADSLLGYFTKHGTAYNHLEDYPSTTYVNGNVTTVVYHAPRAVTGLVQQVTGSSELATYVDGVMDKLVTSHGDPGQPKQYKTIPETIRDISSLTNPDAPVLPTTPEELPAFTGQIAANITVDAATTAGGALGAYAGNQIAGPVGGTIGQQVGQEAGRQVGQAAAPIVSDLASSATQSALAGNPQPLVDTVNSMLPAGVPPLVLPH